MTKKDFVALADAICVLPPGDARGRITAAIIDVCARANPRFNVTTFMDHIAKRTQQKDTRHDAA